MLKDKLKWHIVDKKYVNYLRKYDDKVENIDEEEKKMYISFLSFELDLMNQKMNKIRKNAVKLYQDRIKNPNSNISKRCCNFKLLEEKSKLYQ